MQPDLRSRHRPGRDIFPTLCVCAFAHSGLVPRRQHLSPCCKPHLNFVTAFSLWLWLLSDCRLLAVFLISCFLTFAPDAGQLHCAVLHASVETHSPHDKRLMRCCQLFPLSHSQCCAYHRFASLTAKWECGCLNLSLMPVAGFNWKAFQAIIHSAS